MAGRAPNPTNRKGHRGTSKRTQSEEETRCVCGQQPLDHEGLMIQCELCRVWQHCACVNILDEKDCPEQYFCEQCKPENHSYLQYYNSKSDTSCSPSSKKYEENIPLPNDASLDEEMRLRSPNESDIRKTLASSEGDLFDNLKRQSRAKRAKALRTRSPSPVASNQKTKESESDEEYLVRADRKKKKVSSKSEDGEFTLTTSRGRKRDTKNSLDDESYKAHEETQSRKSTRKDRKEHHKDSNSSQELGLSSKATPSSDDVPSSGKRKKSKKAPLEQARNTTRAKEHGSATPDRRSPPIRVKNVSNRMTFQEMSRRTKYIFDCITRIQIAISEKAKNQSTTTFAATGSMEEPTTMEMVEGLTRKLVQFQELYGEMR